MDNPETVTTLGTRHRTKTTRTINTTHYVLGTTMQNTKDEYKQTINTTQYVLGTTM